MPEFGATHERLEKLEVRRGSDRNFGVVFAGVTAILAVLAFWNGRSSAWAWLLVAAAFAIAAVIAPGVLAPLNRAWHAFGLLLGRVMNPVIMGLVFFVAVTPVALLMRLTGKDPLRLKRDRELPSYWIHRDPPGPKSDSMPLQY